MKNHKMLIQYDGTKYNGWQKQGNTENTIQSKLENILQKLTGMDVPINGSGRTDAGTHAKAQIANFKIETKLSEKELMNYFNSYLPADIGVLSIEIVNERFHSRLSAKGKKYLYRINNSNIPNVFERNYVWQVCSQLDISKMQEASKIFVGEHDFIAFSSLKKSKKSTIRTIYSIDIYEENGEIKFLFYGNGFLYNMIRILVGSLVEVGEGKKSPEQIKNALEENSREYAGFTAPSCGLCLVDVEY